MGQKHVEELVYMWWMWMLFEGRGTCDVGEGVEAYDDGIQN